MSIFKAFRKQNRALTRDLTKAEWRSLRPFVEHHSGGLLVAGESVDYTDPDGVEMDIYCKMHDTWGDPDDPNEGPIVVHIYDTNESPEGDVVLYFTSAVSALELFLNEQALASIWKATR